MKSLLYSPSLFITEESSLRSDLVNSMLFSYGILLFNIIGVVSNCVLYGIHLSYFYFNMACNHFIS